MKIPYLTEYRANKAAERARLVAEQTRTAMSAYFPSFFRQLSWGAASNTLNNEDIFANWSGICIDIVAKSTAKVKNKVYVNDELNEDNNYWLNAFLKNPTHKDYNLTWIEIKELLLKWILSYGNAYLYIPKTNYKYPTQCWVLPAKSVNVIPSANNIRMIDSYIYYSDNGATIISPDDIIHFKTINPSSFFVENFLIGTPYQLNSAKQAVLSEKERKLFEQKYYEREGVRPIFIKDKGEMNDLQWQNFQERLNQTMPKNYQVVGVLENDRQFEALDVGLSGSSAGSSITSDNNENKKIIARSFGIPYGILDTESQQNRATAETNEANFRTGTIEHWVDWFESAFNKFIQRYDPSVLIKHETFVWDNPEDIIKRQTFEISYGIKTINDVRLESGLEEIEGGDVPLIPGSLQPITQSQTSPGLLTQLDSNIENELKNSKTIKHNAFVHNPITIPQSVKQPDEMTKMILWKTIDKQRTKHEKLIEKKAVGLYSALRDEYLGQIKKSKSLTKKVGDIDIDINKWLGIFNEQLQPSASTALTETMQGAIKDYDPTSQLSDYEKEFAKALKTALQDPQMSLQTIVDEMDAKLKQVRTDNPDATPEELNELLKDEIKGNFNGRLDNIGYIKAKANMTGVMMSGFTSNVGVDVVIKRVGLDKVWLSRRDGRVRPSHRAMDGAKAVDGVFTGTDGSKGEFPCAMTFSTAMRIRCRCYMFAQKGTGKQNTKPAEGFKPAKTKQEADEYTVNKLKLNSLLDEIPLNVHNEINQSLTSLMEEFPPSKFETLKTQPGVRTMAAADKREMLFTKRYFQGDDLYDKAVQQSTKTGFLHRGTISKKATIDHEYAHVLTHGDFSYGEIKSEIMKIKNRYRKAMQKIYNEQGQDFINHPDFISHYSNKNLDEFAAESFSMARNTENPSVYAKEVYEVIKKHYGKKK